MKTLIIHNLDEEFAIVGRIILPDDGAGFIATGIGVFWSDADRVKITNLSTLEQAFPSDGIEWLFGIEYEINHHSWLEWSEIVDDQPPVIPAPRKKSTPGPEPQPYPQEMP